MEPKIETVNGVIDYTKLGPGASGRGIFSAWIGVAYDGGGQGFGGYGMDEPIFENPDPQAEGRDRGRFLRRQGTAWGMEFIARILAVLEVEEWEKLKGTPIRVKREHSKIHAIGHYYKDQWFNPEQDLKHMIEAAT